MAPVDLAAAVRRCWLLTNSGRARTCTSPCNTRSKLAPTKNYLCSNQDIMYHMKKLDCCFIWRY